jgi:hypothetical protein
LVLEGRSVARPTTTWPDHTQELGLGNLYLWEALCRPTSAIVVQPDVDPNWEKIAGILHNAYRLVAPKTLVKKLDKR